ncbi:MAG: fibronectin type III domain-containing protein [Gammaproteobacteria bacterium]|nr:fibronectin type III domain-containing protein [Gammaproteobacteria bacterium]
MDAKPLLRWKHRVRWVISLSEARGKGRIDLTWEKPTDGGKVAAYKIKCREHATGTTWSNADTAMETAIILTGQQQGKELEFCVVAVNKAGEGMASNTVTAVL